MNLFKSWFPAKSALDQVLEQNRILQASLLEALRTSQQLNQVQMTSLDRVIMSRFDAPYREQSFEQPNNGSQFPPSMLSDVLNMEDIDFLNLDLS